MPQTFHCPACQAPLDYDGREIIVRCPYCSSSVIVPEGLRPAQPASPSGGLRGNVVDLAAVVQQLTELIHDGKKIQAIKLYHDTFEAGLTEAKAAVEQLERGQGAAFGRVAVIMSTDPQATLSEVRALLESGRKIEAIKVYRQAFGVGLADAKTAVEQMARGETVTPPAPESQEQALARILALIQAGDQAGAVRAYRQAFDTSQAAAEKAVEMLAQGESVAAIQTALAALRPSPAVKITPAVREAAAARSFAGCGCLGLGLFIVLVTIVPISIAMAQPGGPLFSLWQRINPASPARLALSFGEEGLGQGLFYDVRSVAVDGEGRIYAADYASGRLQVFDNAGRFLSLWSLGEEQYIPGISASHEGRVYVAQRGHLYEFQGPDGEMLREFRYPADRSAYFDDVAVTAEGSVWALSDSDDLLVLFDSQGEMRQTIPLTEALIPRLSSVERVDVDGAGNLYLLGDTSDFQGFHQRVFKLSPGGQFLGQFGDSGEGDGLFGSTNDLAVDGQGRVYVADSWVGVQVFDSSGRYLYRFSVDGVAFGLAFDRAGALYIASNKEMIFKYELRFEENE